MSGIITYRDLAENGILDVTAETPLPVVYSLAASQIADPILEWSQSRASDAATLWDGNPSYYEDTGTITVSGAISAKQLVLVYIDSASGGSPGDGWATAGTDPCEIHFQLASSFGGSTRWGTLAVATYSRALSTGTLALPLLVEGWLSSGFAARLQFRFPAAPGGSGKTIGLYATIKHAA